MLDYGIEVHLKEDISNVRGNNFLTVLETLSRIGMVDENEEYTLNQACHIFSKKGKYYIMHYGEVVEMDEGFTAYDDTDLERRDCIAMSLERWGLLTVLDQPEPTRKLSALDLRVIKYSEKNDWNFQTKCTIGNAVKKD